MMLQSWRLSGACYFATMGLRSGQTLALAYSSTLSLHHAHDRCSKHQFAQHGFVYGPLCFFNHLLNATSLHYAAFSAHRLDVLRYKRAHHARDSMPFLSLSCQSSCFGLCDSLCTRPPVSVCTFDFLRHYHPPLLPQPEQFLARNLFSNPLNCSTLPALRAFFAHSSLQCLLATLRFLFSSGPRHASRMCELAMACGTAHLLFDPSRGRSNITTIMIWAKCGSRLHRLLLPPFGLPDECHFFRSPTPRRHPLRDRVRVPSTQEAAGQEGRHLRLLHEDTAIKRHASSEAIIPARARIGALPADCWDVKRRVRE